VRDVWISSGLRARIADWFGVRPIFRAGQARDRGGPIVVDLPAFAGYTIAPRTVLVDLYRVPELVSEALESFALGVGGVYYRPEEMQ
jgi:hypothetical protein